MSSDNGRMVTCRKCGKAVEWREALGVGFGGRTIWTCLDCITPESMDEVFASIGDAVRQEIRRSQEAAE